MHATVAVLVALTNLSIPQDPDAGARDTSAGGIRFVDPPFAVPAELRDSIQFGYLTVPQDHANPAFGTFRLAFAVLSAHTSSPAPDPIVFLPGGPGMSVIEPWTLEAARAERIGLLREQRDFIILEPRGHGLSEPHTCAELNGIAPPTTTSPLGEENLARALERCRMVMTAAGVRLETLNAVQVSRDLELLRQALGAPQLNLLGVSYGSRLAAEAMRTVPTSIRSVALIGPVPAVLPHGEGDDARSRARLDVLFERCRQQASCNSAYPTLRADYDTVLARARRAPLTVTLAATPQIPEGHIVLDDDALESAMAALLFERGLAANAPLLIHTLASRGLDPLLPLASSILSTIDNSAESFGTFLAFRCNDAHAHADTAAWGTARCRAWLGNEYNHRRTEPVRSDIPALVMAGEFDPRTPPEYARVVAAGLTQAIVLDIPWHGHEYALECVNRIERDFFNAPRGVPASGCLDSLPPLRFVSGVTLGGWTSSIAVRAAASPLPVAGLAGVALLLFVPATWVSAVEVRARSGVPQVRRRESLALLLAALAGLVFVFAAAGALLAGSRKGVMVPALGVPDEWRWVLALPWVLGAAALVVAGVSFKRLRTGERTGTLLAACLLMGIVLLLGTSLAA